MKDRQTCRINISAPNLVNICVDRTFDGEMSGRLYHCYTKEPWRFSNVVQLLRMMEMLYDGISFPQASTLSRHFMEPEKREKTAHEKVREQKEIITYRGEIGTFITCVRYRQNSAWQGDVVWMEQEIKETFFSALEFIKILNNALTEE